MLKGPSFGSSVIELICWDCSGKGDGGVCMMMTWFKLLDLDKLYLSLSAGIALGSEVVVSVRTTVLRRTWFKHLD